MVAADVEVVALHRGHKANVFALGLSTLAHAAGDAHLHLVRGAEALVALLELHSHGHGVLLAEAAPRGADAALHSTQSLTVGLAALHSLGLDRRLHLDAVVALEAGAARHEVLPDVWKLPNARAEEAHTLRASNLHPEVVLEGHSAHQDHLLRRDLTTRHPGDHGVLAAALDVGHDVVVRVLELSEPIIHRHLVPERGKDRGHDRLADLIAHQGRLHVRDLAHARTLLHDVLVGLQLLHSDDLEELRAREGEVRADAGEDRLAHGFERGLEDLRDEAGRQDAAATAVACRGALLDVRDGAGVVILDCVDDLTLGHLLAEADDRVIAEILGVTIAGAAQEEVTRHLLAEVLLLGEVQQREIVLGVAHKEASEQLMVLVEGELAVKASEGVHLDGVRQALLLAL
mmetsp:Transcript_113270/g.156505  ORF Transcript_113270/g.156505 Transcript_113270/m.156505 type:complete len:402 (-) Transcript_113270:46-1251(-)